MAPRDDHRTVSNLGPVPMGQRVGVVGADYVGSEHPNEVDPTGGEAVSNLREVGFGDVGVAAEGDVEDGGVGLGVEPVGAVGLGPEAGCDGGVGEAGGEDGSDGVEAGFGL